MRLASFAAIALLLGFAAARPAIDPSTLTASGISAGGAFAVQLGVAHSSKFRAVGIVAGIPWYCAGSSGVEGAYSCMDDPLTISVPTLNWEMSASAQAGDIDAVSNIANQAVMLFSGLYDTEVNHGTMELLSQQYTALNVSKQITYFNYSAEHAWITNFYGNGCTYLGSPYVNNCGLDFAGEFLHMAFDHMNVPWNPTIGTMVAGNLQLFSQVAFGASSLTNSLDTNGYYYVPTACATTGSNKTRCHIHVSFHGCAQYAGTIGTAFVANTGLNQWAEANNVIVVYPQTTANALVMNPEGCFDWWGYAGSHYADKQGVQVQFVMAIIDALVTTGTLPPAAW